MLLKQFKVKNYKNFQHEFKLDFTNIKNYDFNRDCLINNTIKNAIIVGETGIGKSNLGRAIVDIAQRFTDSYDYESSNGYSHVDAIALETQFCYTFSDDDDDIIYKYIISDRGNFLFEMLQVNDEVLFQYDYRKNNNDPTNFTRYGIGTWEGPKFSDKSALKYIADNSFLPDDHPSMKLIRFARGMTFVDNSTAQNTEKIENMIAYIIRTKHVADFQKFLCYCNVFEELMESPASQQPELFLVYKNGKLPFSKVASSGMHQLLYLYYLYIKLEASDKSFIYIDDFDAYYHCDASEQIVKLLKEKFDVQILFTSHSTNLLSNRLLRPDCCFVLTANRLSSFANATLRELREEHNLEKLYISGEFEALKD